MKNVVFFLSMLLGAHALAAYECDFTAVNTSGNVVASICASYDDPGLMLKAIDGFETLYTSHTVTIECRKI